MNAIQAQGNDTLEILELDRFDTAFAVSPDRAAATRRRFMTLLIDGSHTREYGSSGYVCRARNAMGESFAVKRLRPDADITAAQDGTGARNTQGQIAAFHEEYRSQLALSSMRGFPRLYGIGEADGQPVIVMEWVEGETLESLRHRLPHGNLQNSVDPSVVAALARALLDILVGLDRLAERPVHRDISPTNIIIRTSSASLEDQILRGEFDTCLVDFGSATVINDYNPRLTMVAGVWRNGTPEYAPPEMLTHDVPGIEALRQSPSIDVYAVSSILYELLMGHTPFRISERGAVSPYLVKTENVPQPVPSEFGSLARAINAGLQRDQAMRPSAADMLAILEGGGDDPRPQGGEPSAPADIPTFLPESMAASHFSLPPTQGAVAPAPVATTAAAAQAASQEHEKPNPSRRAFVIGAATLVGVAAIGGIAAFMSQQGTGEPGSSTSTDSSSQAAKGLAVPINDNALLLAQDPESSLWGYLDTQGQWAIEPRFGYGAGNFHEDLAWAIDDTSLKIGFIDRSGNWAIKPSFNVVGDFGPDGIAYARPGQLYSGSIDKGPLGFIDRTGAWVLKPQYYGVTSFNCGLAGVLPEDSKVWHYVDENGKYVIYSYTFIEADAFTDDKLALVRIDQDRWSYIDTNGGELIEPTQLMEAHSFSEGLAVIRDVNRNYGTIDTSGALSVDSRFTMLGDYHNGLAMARGDDSGRIGFVDTAGEWVIEPQFKSGRDFGDSLAGVYDFRDGLAGVRDPETGLYGFIDSTGAWVIEPEFPRIGADERSAIRSDEVRLY